MPRQVLLTHELKATLPPLYACEQQDDPVVLAKFFCPWGRYTWFAYEASAHLHDGRDVSLQELGTQAYEDVTFFGFVRGNYPPDDELGTFSLNELLTVRGPFGLYIERDTAWRPTPLSAVRNHVA